MFYLCYKRITSKFPSDIHVPFVMSCPNFGYDIQSDISIQAVVYV